MLDLMHKLIRLSCFAKFISLVSEPTWLERSLCYRVPRMINLGELRPNGTGTSCIFGRITTRRIFIFWGDCIGQWMFAIWKAMIGIRGRLIYIVVIRIDRLLYVQLCIDHFIVAPFHQQSEQFLLIASAVRLTRTFPVFPNSINQL